MTMYRKKIYNHVMKFLQVMIILMVCFCSIAIIKVDAAEKLPKVTVKNVKSISQNAAQIIINKE